MLLDQAIESYTKRNWKIPGEIIIFLNSCSSDQIQLYLEYFLEPSQSRIKSQFENRTVVPSFTFVMVNTKTNERFFTSGRNAGETKNVPAGTLVATDIVSQHYDFFLTSQFSNKGSTVPSHYRVVYSDSKMEEGLLQEIIFSQSFNYVNWTGSIKIPGILQYARKSAKFISEVGFDKPVIEDISDKFFYV